MEFFHISRLLGAAMTLGAWKAYGPMAAVVVTIAGGTFLGLFPCGGYVWHTQAIVGSLIALAALTVVFPPEGLNGWKRKGAFLFAVATGFILIRASASSFYPHAPESIGEFLRLTWLGLVYGPC